MATQDAVCAIAFAGSPATENPNAQTRECVKQLREYFDGKRQAFELHLKPAGTPFQLAVWRELEKIPYAATRSYQQIAAALGNPAAVRAVGQANKSNPLAVVVPCHRVIQKNGKPGGYNGLPWRKEWLLAKEASL